MPAARLGACTQCLRDSQKALLQYIFEMAVDLPKRQGLRIESRSEDSLS